MEAELEGIADRMHRQGSAREGKTRILAEHVEDSLEDAGAGSQRGSAGGWEVLGVPLIQVVAVVLLSVVALGFVHVMGIDLEEGIKHAHHD